MAVHSPALNAVSDLVVVRLCQVADEIDRLADSLSAGVADLPVAHPNHVAAFEVIDPMMAGWHALRAIVARMPARTPWAQQARDALLQPDGDLTLYAAR